MTAIERCCGLVAGFSALPGLQAYRGGARQVTLATPPPATRPTLPLAAASGMKAGCDIGLCSS